MTTERLLQSSQILVNGARWYVNFWSQIIVTVATLSKLNTFWQVREIVLKRELPIFFQCWTETIMKALDTRESPGGVAGVTPIKALPFSPSQFLNSPSAMNFPAFENVPGSTPVRLTPAQARVCSF